MTVIVGAHTDKGITIACDGQTTSGWERVHRHTPKIWTTGGQFILGSAGSVRTAQVVKHHLAAPKHRSSEDDDIEKFLVTRFVPAIREAVKDKGVTRTKEGTEELDVDMLVAWGDNLAVIGGDGSILTSREGRIAVGSGYAQALGALGSGKKWKVADVVEAARRAVESNIGCGGMVRYASTSDLVIHEDADGS